MKENKVSYLLNCFSSHFIPISYLLVLPMISKMENNNGLRLNYFNFNLSSMVLGFLIRRMEIIDSSLC